jgi:hypothetical protein
MELSATCIVYLPTNQHVPSCRVSSLYDILLQISSPQIVLHPLLHIEVSDLKCTVRLLRGIERDLLHNLFNDSMEPSCSNVFNCPIYLMKCGEGKVRHSRGRIHQREHTDLIGNMSNLSNGFISKCQSDRFSFHEFDLCTRAKSSMERGQRGRTIHLLL